MAGTHAHYSPSGSERFHGCSGAPAFALKLPKEHKDKSGPAAQLGTAAHGLLEKCLTDMKAPSAFRDRIIELIGEEEGFSMLKPSAKAPGAGRIWFIVDEDMVEGVTEAYEYVLNRCEELFVDPADALIMEGRTNPLPDRDDTSGTADVTIDVKPFLLEVVDYKNGFVTVEHVDNPQLLSYLCGRAEDTGWAHEMYRITVVQPNGFHPEGTTRSYEVTKDELRAFQVKHRTAVEKCDAAEAALNDAGRVTDEWQQEWLTAGDHCTMCPAAAICIVKRQSMQAEARKDFADLPPTDEEIDAEVQNLERAAEVAQWGPAVKKYIESAQKYLINAYDAGRQVPGKMVRKNTKRVWGKEAEGLTPAELAVRLVKEGYISDNERALLLTTTEPKLIGGPAVEKLVPAAKRAAFAAAYLHKPSGALEWAPEEDKRRAVNPGDGARADFADE